MKYWDNLPHAHIFQLSITTFSHFCQVSLAFPLQPLKKKRANLAPYACLHSAITGRSAPHHDLHSSGRIEFYNVEVVPLLSLSMCQLPQLLFHFDLLGGEIHDFVLTLLLKEVVELYEGFWQVKVPHVKCILDRPTNHCFEVCLWSLACRYICVHFVYYIVCLSTQAAFKGKSTAIRSQRLESLPKSWSLPKFSRPNWRPKRTLF